MDKFIEKITFQSDHVTHMIEIHRCLLTAQKNPNSCPPSPGFPQQSSQPTSLFFSNIQSDIVVLLCSENSTSALSAFKIFALDSSSFWKTLLSLFRIVSFSAFIFQAKSSLLQESPPGSPYTKFSFPVTLQVCYSPLFLKNLSLLDTTEFVCVFSYLLFLLVTRKSALRE